MKMVLFKHYRLLSSKDLIFLHLKNHNRNRNIYHIKFLSSNSESKEVKIQLSNGQCMILSTGKYARFANASIIAKSGETSVMSTVVRENENNANDGIPLIVNYRQKAAAIGRIPTNFLRRELGQSENEILVSRVIDRSLRPLFAQGYSCQTQIICNLLAVDGINDPEVLSINAASAALSISDVPWNGPVAAVRVGMIDDQYIINPSRRELQQSKLNLVLCASSNLIVMMEGSGEHVSKGELKNAIKVGIKECHIIAKSILKLQKQVEKSKFEINTNKDTTDEVSNLIKKLSESELRKIFTCYSYDKVSRDIAISDLKKTTLNSINDNCTVSVTTAEKLYNNIVKEIFRSVIFETGRRCDGRKLQQLREMLCQVGLFQPVHGSGFFQRGQTQVLCTVTLDSIENSLKLDTASMLTSGIKEKNFFLHYEFPPYATNTTSKTVGMNRREIGHGALAEKGLRAVIPKDYPFTIRLTNEVLESNGSSSMASICAGSLALMNAGVPISSAVAGIAMGLVSKFTSETNDVNYIVLTDISGIEDHFGDMDFKIAGSKMGFTALQVDVKIPGVPVNIIMKIIEEARKGLNKIIDKMDLTISSPVKDKKDNSPVVEVLEVPVHLRGKFFGVGGMNIKKINYETGVSINMQSDTEYSIFAPNRNAMNEAKEMINKILQADKEPTLNFGDIYTAKITEIRENGVMVTLYPTMVPSLLPNSQLDIRKIHHPSVLGFTVGDEIQVKYFGRDPVSGQIRLSRKVLQETVPRTKNLISK